MSSPGSPPPAAPPPLTEGTRSLLSFLIFVQLFILGAGVLGRFPPESQLRAALENVGALRHYRQLLFWDIPYNYYYTYNFGGDHPTYLEIEVDWRGQTNPDAKILRFPTIAASRAERAHAERLLSNAANLMLEDNSAESNLLSPLAQRLLAEAGIQSGKHRLRMVRHAPVSLEAGGGTDLAAKDPQDPRHFSTPYEADLSFAADEFILKKVASRLENTAVQREEPR